MKCQILFARKINIDIISLLSAEIIRNMVNVKRFLALYQLTFIFKRDSLCFQLSHQV